MSFDYPEYAEINGKKYKIDTDYRTALRCFEVVNDSKITDYERALAIVYLLFDIIPKKNFNLFLEKAIIFLECGENNKTTKRNIKKDFDFLKDYGLIVASFMSDFHINISVEKLHFWYFVKLIEGLKDDCILNKVRDIRNVDLSKVTDKETRDRLAEAKQFYELDDKVPTKEQEKSALDFYENLKI